MCTICNCSPCAPRCPNAKQRTVYLCERCGEPIVEDEIFYYLEGDYYHKDCFEENVIELILEKELAYKGRA